jgi:hypothetical protein
MNTQPRTKIGNRMMDDFSTLISTNARLRRSIAAAVSEIRGQTHCCPVRDFEKSHKSNDNNEPPPKLI